MNVNVKQWKKATRVNGVNGGDWDANRKAGTFVDRAGRPRHRCCRIAQTHTVTLGGTRWPVDDNIE